MTRCSGYLRRVQSLAGSGSAPPTVQTAGSTLAIAREIGGMTSPPWYFAARSPRCRPPGRRSSRRSRRWRTSRRSTGRRASPPMELSRCCPARDPWDGPPRSAARSPGRPRPGSAGRRVRTPCAAGPARPGVSGSALITCAQVETVAESVRRRRRHGDRRQHGPARTDARRRRSTRRRRAAGRRTSTSGTVTTVAISAARRVSRVDRERPRGARPGRSACG